MKRNQLWMMISLLMVVGMLVAAQCPSTGGPAPTKEPEMVTIRWRTRPDNKAEQDVYQKISDDLRACENITWSLAAAA
ncbi:MAG: hypothetical protein KKB13_20700 [Chloroflexi bacterium]|nr:hypothetical protein [Chloroflexota bacterium]